MTDDPAAAPDRSGAPAPQQDEQVPELGLPVLEADETVPPRPEEVVADAANERASDPEPKTGAGAAPG